MVGHYYVNVLIIMTIVSHFYGNPSHVYPLGQCKQSPSTFQLEMLKVWQVSIIFVDVSQVARSSDNPQLYSM